MTLAVTNPPAPVVLYRAWQMDGGAPTLTFITWVGPRISFALRGVPGQSYVIESSTHLGAAALWAPVLNLTLTNSTGLFEWTNNGEHGRFFRASPR